ncbi:hydantoinase B/oxoprolinase family protein [SAR202 cluster bacterium AD-804-J14_MRT_500m]|nr:hydantoinase B/oxoprolinase family protein [SAR202 cluster bacterium AD-804-J14_MRT_500m]
MVTKKKKIQSKASLDSFTAEIMRSYLVSTVEEMVETTVRSAYSTCLSEGRDFTCALFDADSRMIAQAYGIPVHSGALFDPMKTLTSTYDKFEPGDVIVFNDPYNGGSHQADVVVASPMFLQKRLIGFAVNRGHWVDVGGMAPGGWSGTARHVIQEALIIPPAKLYKAGNLDREIRDFILKNVRLPKQCWGDIQAQIASNIVAERRVSALIHKYGIKMVQEGMEEALNYSRKRFHNMLEALPDGAWEGTDYQEDDGHGGGPHKIHVKLTKSGKKVTLDFTGSSPQVRGPVNCTFTETKAGCYTALMNVVDPWVPLNSGSIEGIKVIAIV